MNTTQEKTSPKLAFCYSLGEVGCQMSWYMINNYLMLFYTDIVGLSATAISMIMLIARVWDAVNDPMMGDIADRTNTRWGRFRPYLMFGPPVLAIFNILTFTVFPVTGIVKVILALVCYIGAGMAYTACSIAYQALQNVCAIDSRVRMNLATARGIGSAVISFILSAIAMPAILKFSAAEVPNAHGYFVFTVLLSVALVPIFWICCWGCKETFGEKLHGGANAKKEKTSFLANLKELVKNDQLLCVVLATVMGALCVSGRMGMLVYYIINVVGNYTVIAKFFSIMTLAQFIGVLLLPPATKYMGKRNYMILLNVIMLIGFILMYVFAHANINILLGISFVLGITNSAANICPGMVGDALEYGDWKLGKRQEGLAASFLSFGVKVATAIVGSAGVLLLAAVGYVPNAEQTEAAKNGINLVVNILPAVVCFLSIIPLFFYKLDDKKVAEIRADLDAGKHAWDK